MLKKLGRDLLRKKDQYPICQDMHNPVLGYYYFVFEESRVSAGKDQALIKKFDANGIPINKTYIDVTDKDYVYFPISIGQMGLSIFHTYLRTKDENDKNRFQNDLQQVLIGLVMIFSGHKGIVRTAN